MVGDVGDIFSFQAKQYEGIGEQAVRHMCQGMLCAHGERKVPSRIYRFQSRKDKLQKRNKVERNLTTHSLWQNNFADKHTATTQQTCGHPFG
jgi:hypothetical protein